MKTLSADTWWWLDANDALRVGIDDQAVNVPERLFILVAPLHGHAEPGKQTHGVHKEGNQDSRLQQRQAACTGQFHRPIR